jgi:hypothetical protein
MVLVMAVALTGVLAVVPASAAAGATLTPIAGPVGAPISVNASGFAPNSILTTTFDGVPATTAPAVVEATTGSAIFSMLVPTATAGAHVVIVTDGVNSVTKTFTVQPKVTITPLQGSAGTVATVTGTGFAAGFTVNATVGGAPLASSVTDSAGGFTATGAIPPGLPAGDATVTAADLAGNDADLNPASFKITPSLAISPANGLAGSTVTVTGTGWAEGNVALTFAGVAWDTDPVSGGVQGVNASAAGTINAPGIPTPATALPGVTQVTGTDTDTIPNTAIASFTVNARPLSATPSSGPMGTSVLIQASNLTPGPGGEVPVGGVEISGADWNTSDINIGTAGEMFPTTLVVPSGLTPGAAIVRATDNQGLVAQGTFTITKPTISVSPTTGPIGTSTTITGAGWVPNSTVTLTFGGPTGSMMTVVADANGNIAAAMTVPATAVPGANAITADDGALGNAAVNATFVVPGAAISITPTEGGPGESVTISGSGLPGYTAIQVTFGGFPIPTMVLTSPLGTFSLATTVPGVAPGAQVVAAVMPGTLQTMAVTYYVVKAAAETVESALAGIVTVLEIVWDYAGGDWLFYDPADAEGSDLDSLTAGTGYWVKVSADADLVYGGHSYSLVLGWNNIGWLGI